HLARERRALARGPYFHAGRGMTDAGGRQHALALDLHHAGATVAIRAITGGVAVAEMRDLSSLALSHLPDRLARPRLHLLAVEKKAHRVFHRVRTVAHARSSAKCFSAIFTGFIAACPRPQIDASVITLASSSRRGPSHLGSASSRTTFSVPTRQGVHWPQLSSSKNFSRFRVTALMSSLSDNTITAAEPMKQPCGSSVPKSSARSPMDAGRMPPEQPPGR